MKAKREPLDISEGSNAQQLLGYIAAILDCDGKLDAINKNKATLYAEAWTIGLDKKLIRKIAMEYRAGKLTNDHQKLARYMELSKVFNQQ